MNKLLITLTTILMLTGLASMPAAKAEEGLYVKLAAGLNHINKSYHKDSLYSGERVNHFLCVSSKIYAPINLV